MAQRGQDASTRPRCTQVVTGLTLGIQKQESVTFRRRAVAVPPSPVQPQTATARSAGQGCGTVPVPLPAPAVTGLEEVNTIVLTLSFPNIDLT